MVFGKKKNKEQAKKQSIQASSQAYLDIAEIRDGVVIMKDGSLRGIVYVSSINFALKSEDEKKSIIYSFQNFLNSLNFPIQIVIRSKKLDLDPYLEKLQTFETKQQNELLKLQTKEYIDFIKKLLDVANIMKKDIFVVVSFYPAPSEKIGFLKKIMDKFQPLKVAEEKETDFETARNQLMQRAELLTSELSHVGVRCASLNTQELIENFYNIYNPETSKREKLNTEAENITGDLVLKQEDSKEKSEINTMEI